jgi:fermentation-respiration switch protein FrsA (DUF1100 family)
MIVFTRERLIGIIVAVILGGVAFVFGLRWLEFAITFHPERIPANETLAVPAGAEEVWFTAADGTRLHGWFFRSESQPETATIIYFHGNGGNITNIDWVGQRLSRRGFDVLLFDYRGYGKSEGEVGDESGLYADGDAALAFVVNQKGARPDRVVLYGQSLGTTVAADIASRQNVGAVILESGLSSASSVGRTALPWLPAWLHFLSTNRFESARKLSHVKAPVLITHGDPDPIIPTEEARILFAGANEPKQLLIFPGAGHNVFGSQGDEYLTRLEQFTRESLR